MNLVTPTCAYCAPIRCRRLGRYSREISPSEVESPMCTTARHAVRPGPVGAGDGVLAAAFPDCGPDAAPPLDGDRLPAATGLDDGCTTPVSPQLASASTETAPATVSLARRPAVRGCQPVARTWAHHRPMAPRRTGSSTNRQDSAAAPMAAASWTIPRTMLSRPPGGVVSTMIGKCHR